MGPTRDAKNRLLLLLAAWLAGCNHSIVVHLPAATGSTTTTAHTANLSSSLPQPLEIGGTRIDATMTECPPGSNPANIRICIGESPSCEKQRKPEVPAVSGITVLYDCAIPDPTPGGGLGAPPKGQ